MTIKELANFVWSIADLLRGDYKQSEYGKVILPLTVLRRMDCVLKDTKQAVLKELERISTLSYSEEMQEIFLNKKSTLTFHNRSNFDFDKLIADPINLASNLRDYIKGFSKDAKDIIEQFKFDDQISKLEESKLLFLVMKRFQEIDLHPKIVDNMRMGYMFEELIRKFAENEAAGEQFTPREVIKLMVNILFSNDNDILRKSSIIKTLYDCCAGTGGMLSVAKEHMTELNPSAHLEVFGQEILPESYAICIYSHLFVLLLENRVQIFI